MIEAGLVSLINNFSSPPQASGGFATELPKDYVVADAIWFYVMAGGSSDSGLLYFHGLIRRHVEFHAAAPTQALANALSDYIDGVLQGFHGVLSDPDATLINSILRSDEPRDYFHEPSRSFRRMREYEILYMQD